MGVVGADDICPVPGADAGRHGGAVLENEGVVIGGKAGGLNFAAHLQVLHLAVGADIAVDKHTGYLALGIPDQDGLNLAVGHLDAGDIAIEGDQLPQNGAVVNLGGGDGLRRHGRTLVQLGDAGDGQLALALVGAGGAADADPVADLEVACHGEAVDAAGFILDIDAIEEGGILIVPGGVGGDDALDGVLEAFLRLLMDIGDGAELHGVEIADQILADTIVGIVFLSTVIQLGLDLEVGHKGCAGDHDETLALQLLSGHDQQAAVVLGIGILRSACAALAVLIHIHRIGGGVAVNHGGDGGGQSGGGVAAGIHGIDGGAAVVAEALSVQLVVGMVSVHDDTACEEVIRVIGAEVEPPLIHTVGGAANIIIGSIVADAEAGAQGLQHIVLGLGHMLDGGVALNDIVVLVVVAPAGQDNRSPGGVEGRQGCELLLAVGLGIGLGLSQAAAGGSEDEGLILGVGAGSDELLTGVQLDGTDTVACGEIAEVAHAVLIVAGHILIIMRSVDADVDQGVGVQDIQVDGLGEGVLVAALLHHGGDLHSEHPGGGGGILKGHIQGAALGEGIAGLVGADDGAADGVGQGLDGGIAILTIEEGGGESQLLIGDGSGGTADHVGDAQLQAFTHPHGGGDGQVAVLLGDADEVVAVAGIQGNRELAAVQLGGVIPGIGYLTGVGHHLHLGDGVGGVGIVDGDLDIQLIGDLGDAGAHHKTVDGVGQLQILILGGVHAQSADGLVDTLLGKAIGEDDVAGIVGIAPLALVVILVVGGGQVPALIQRHDVLLIAGIVAAGADLTLAVTHLHHVHTAVDDGIPVVEILEVAEGGAGVVELADGGCALGLAQQGVIGLHARVGGLVVQSAVVAGDDAGGIEGVDMAGAAGPGHLEATDGHHVAGVVLVELGDGVLVGLPAVAGIGILDQGGVIEGGLHIGGILGIEIVGVVGEGHELDVGAVGQASDIAQGAVQRAGAVGILGMAMELPKVGLIGGLAHSEEPAELGRLAVGAGGGDLNGDAAIGHVSGGGVGDTAAFIGGCHGLAAHGHGDGGVLAGIGQSHGNGGTLILAGLAAPGGGGIGEDGLVLDGDLSGGEDGNVLIVRATDVHGELITRDGGGGDGDGVGAILALGDGERGAVELGGHVTPHAEGGVHGEGEGIVRAHIGIGQVAQDHGGVIHDAVRDRARAHGVEGEGVDGVVGDIIHGIDLEAVTVILQPLAVFAAEFGGAVLHLVAAHAAGAGADQPIGIVAGGLGIESVVAGAVCAEVAVGLVVEAVVVAVFLHLEHHGAVGAGSLAILNGGGGLVDGGAGCIIVLRSQDSLGILIVDDHLVAHGGETAGGLVGAAHRDELQGIEVITGFFIGISGELLKALGAVDKPLHIIGGAVGINEVEAAVGLGFFHLPGVIDLVQGQTIAVCVHGQLLAIGGGDGVDAVFGGDRPNEVLGGVCYLAVGDGDILTGPVIGAGGIGGHGLAAVGVIDDILAISHQRLIHRDELQGIEVIAGFFIGISGELLEALGAVDKPLHIIGGAVGVNEVEAAVGLGFFHLPGVIDLVQGQTIAVCVHGQLLAIGGGDGVDAVFGGDRPNEVLGGVCYLAVGDGDILTGPVIGAGGIGGHGLAAAGVIDDILAVLDEGGGSRLGVGGLAAGVDHQIELLGEQGLVSGADGGLGAEVDLVGIPLEGVAADDILDVEAALGGGGGDGPLGVHIIQGNAGIAGTHGELLAIGGGKGILAVLDAQGPQLGIAVAGELIGAIQRHIHTGAVISGYRCGGHGLFDRGVEYDDLVAILQGGQVCDDAALAGGCGIQLIESEIAGIAVGFSGNSAVFICLVLIAGAGISCQLYGVGALPREGKGAISKSNRPLVAAARNAIVVAAQRGDGYAVGIGEDNAICTHGDGPYALGCCGCGTVDRDGRCGDPLAAEFLGREALFVHQHILAGDQLFGGCDLFEGLWRRVCREHRCGQQRQQHDQRQQDGQEPPAMSSLLQNLIPPVHFTR